MTESGVVRTRSFWRRPLSERWSTDLFRCHVSVLQPNAADPNVTTIGIRAPVWLPEQAGAPESQAPDDTTRRARRLQLSKSYFEKPDIGFTIGCAACDSLRLGRPRTGSRTSSWTQKTLARPSRLNRTPLGCWRSGRRSCRPSVRSVRCSSVRSSFGLRSG